MNHALLYVALACTGAVLCALVGGCPTTSDDTSAVTAVIGISSTQGDPPLPVTVTAIDSTSTNGGTLTYLWDFGGEATATTATANHTFTTPGFYTITLVVTDQNNEQDTATVDVRIRGTATPVAVIQVDTNSGPIPLAVVFDGSDSYADDDTIRDYYWDFGDGSSIDRRTAPSHVYQRVGTFTVTLTVETGGGVEGSATTIITAGEANGSLQFDGSQFASLPSGASAALDTCTFEAWVKAGTTGGTLVTVGSLAIQVLPDSNAIRFQISGSTHEGSASALSGQWRHIALTYNTAGDATLYLDGVALTSAAAGAAIDATQLSLGNGFVGKVADVRFWSEARSASNIAANYDSRLSGAGAALIGYWRLDDGSGQTLENEVGADGTRGASTTEEASDPAWSTDGPNID